MKGYILQGTLYRFGYSIEVIAETEEEVKKAIMDEYTRAYVSANGTDPKEDESDREEGRTAYEVAEEDIEIREFTLGIVMWL